MRPLKSPLESWRIVCVAFFPSESRIVSDQSLNQEVPMTTATSDAPPVADVHLENAWLVARTADDFKGKDILVLDMQAITPLVDYFVIVTAHSVRQMRAMGEEVNRLMKARGRGKAVCEGAGPGTLWLLYDYGDVVLHVFTPEGRDLFQLENLWADAPHIEWREPGRPIRNDDEYENYFAQHYQPDDEDEYDESDPELEMIAKTLPKDEFDDSRYLDQDDDPLNAEGTVPDESA